MSKTKCKSMNIKFGVHLCHSSAIYAANATAVAVVVFYSFLFFFHPFSGFYTVLILFPYIDAVFIVVVAC